VKIFGREAVVTFLPPFSQVGNCQLPLFDGTCLPTSASHLPLSHGLGQGEPQSMFLLGAMRPCATVRAAAARHATPARPRPWRPRSCHFSACAHGGRKGRVGTARRASRRPPPPPPLPLFPPRLFCRGFLSLSPPPPPPPPPLSSVAPLLLCLRLCVSHHCAAAVGGAATHRLCRCRFHTRAVRALFSAAAK